MKYTSLITALILRFLAPTSVAFTFPLSSRFERSQILKYFGSKGNPQFEHRKEKRSDRHYLQLSFNDNDNDGAQILENGRELRWNIINLLHKDNDKRDSIKRELLQTVFVKAMKAHEDALEEEASQPKYQPKLPAHLAPMRRFLLTSSIEKDHEGFFRIFDDSFESTVTMASNLLFSMDHPLSYIRKILSYQSEDAVNKGSMICNNAEAVVFCVQNDQNLEYTSRILDDMPLAQLHMGNLPDCQVELDLDTINTLESFELLEKQKGDQNTNVELGLNNESVKNTMLCNLKSQDLDVIRSFLCCNIHDPNLQLDSQIQKSLIKLIDNAVESAQKGLLGKSNEPHLVLIAHSTSASMVAAAISAWKQQKIRISPSATISQVEDLLLTAITVITVGAVCQQFCDGPAYIHISMFDDKLAQTVGVTRNNNNSAGGKNAVYFHAWSPYDERNDSSLLRGHDAHNMNACATQFLYLIMRINGITSFRALYDAANFVDPRAILDIDPCNFAVNYSTQGDLVIPPRIDSELLPAMIRASGGEHCLWNPPPLPCEENGHDEDSPLPDPIESKSYLEESFGYSAYEEIYETCLSSKLCSTTQ